MKLNRKVQAKALRHAIAVGAWAFLLATCTSVASQAGTERIEMFAAGLVLLIVVIFTGIVFDVVGVAATAAQEGPLHARAAHRVFGARQAVQLVRDAHKVASFCNDVVGDVSGTLSGAIGVTLILKLLHSPTEKGLIMATSLMTASIAALVVGGKAYGKVYGLERATEIMFRVGQLVALAEYIPGVRRMNSPHARKRRRGSSR